MEEGEGKPKSDLDEAIAEIQRLADQLEAKLMALLTRSGGLGQAFHHQITMIDHADLVLKGPDGEIKETRHA